MTVSLKAIDFIIQQEVSSKDAYNRNAAQPTWPQGESGVTIGIGYDLGYNSAAEIASDWDILPAAQITLLQSASGKKGTVARDFLAANPSLRATVIPYDTAVGVFVSKSLPKVAAEALAIYPGLDQLFPDAAGALISMVYNRGDSLTGDRRKEMRAIVPLVAAKDYIGIAAQIDASKRLWQGIGMAGLVSRRENEAALIRNADRQYAANETVQLNTTA